MSTLLFERSLPRFAAARVVSSFGSGRGAGVGPVAPGRPRRTRPCPRPAGCTSTPSCPASAARTWPPWTGAARATSRTSSRSPSCRATRSSARWPRTPRGRGRAAARRRAGWCCSRCSAARPGGSSPPAPPARPGTWATAATSPSGTSARACRRASAPTPVAAGRRTGLVAHSTPALRRARRALTDEDAVTVEPVACAVHAVLGAPIAAGDVVAVIGAGTLGLLVTAALGHLCRQRAAAPRRRPCSSGHATRTSSVWPASWVPPRRCRPTSSAAPCAGTRARCPTGAPPGVTATLSGGADVVLDCVGSPESIAQSLAMVPAAGHRGAGRHAGQGDRRPGAPLAPRGPPGGGLRLRDRTERRHGCDRSDDRFDVLPGLRRRRRAARPGAWSRPPTRWPASRMPWPMPAPPVAAAPSRSHSTYGKDRSDEPPSRLRPRGRQVDATDPLLERRGLRPRDAARGQSRRLRPRAHEGDRGSLPGHPPRLAPPRGRPRPAAGAAPPGHEADHLLRRRLAAAAAHGGARHPPDGDRDGARHGGGGRSGRRRAHRRAWRCTAA